jgi:putative transposase
VKKSVGEEIDLSKIVQYIKGKSSRKLLQEFKILEKRYWGQHLWARGYFAVTVENVNAKEVQKYIEEQEDVTKLTISGYQNFNVHVFNLDTLQVFLKPPASAGRS